MELWNPRSLLMLLRFQETRLTIYLVVLCCCFVLWCMPLLASDTLFPFLFPLTDKERTKYMNVTYFGLFGLFAAWTWPIIFSDNCFVTNKEISFLFCTKLGSQAHWWLYRNTACLLLLLLVYLLLCLFCIVWLNCNFSCWIKTLADLSNEAINHIKSTYLVSPNANPSVPKIIFWL